MICPQCQCQIPATAPLCGECVARLESPCPKCDGPNRKEAKFCRSFGHRAAVDQPIRSSSYVSKNLAKKILTSRRALEGEGKQVTILFADIRDSIQQSVDPGAAQKLIDPILKITMDAVHGYEGTAARSCTGRWPYSMPARA